MAFTHHSLRALSQRSQPPPAALTLSRSTRLRLPPARHHSTQSASAASASATASSSRRPASSLASSTTPPTDPFPDIDPLRSIKTELASLRSSVSRLLGSGHPALDTIAKYYFHAEGKHIRPQIVLLMARATNGLSPLWPSLQHRAQNELDMSVGTPISPTHILNDHNPHAQQQPSSTSSSASSSTAPTLLLLPTQRRLAEITEMIHVASLLHDDVIDEASLRRSLPSAPASFGNKLSILAGDFLLGRASVALARLRDCEVVELLATVIANLVEGEVMQLKGAPAPTSSTKADGMKKQGEGEDEEVQESLAAFEQVINAPSSSSSAQSSPLSSFLSFDPMASLSSSTYPEGGPTREQFAHYLQKTYLKTASLIGKSARAATILGGCGAEAVDRFVDVLSVGPVRDQAEVEQGRERCREIRDAAYWFGRNLGMAFQLVDDLLDFRTTSNMFGKPSGGADLRLGLATAPVLYAWQELGTESGLAEMIARKFEGEGDVEKALRLVLSSQALQRTASLADHYAQQARQSLDVLPPSDAKDALVALTRQVTSRMK
ncbi:unnamed protein product [Tilletia caries]|uniref:(2E,6E)-farnesyl diphosphate synthase n=1 Tax=Tilletia controversa TaxID=13291 RepID=A0A8X7MZB5_9BASI|nr:hypothetical protein CF328_g889 [Tilletia controversa]KAE8254239.1 hypothetical protein A4X06_0g991 [Tilletia controversa]CAD6893239.1 unnamed protein product [Tilletia caries]CAD6940931.1 unnamed protein product [Tilletia controversa]